MYKSIVSVKFEMAVICKQTQSN